MPLILNILQMLSLTSLKNGWTATCSADSLSYGLLSSIPAKIIENNPQREYITFFCISCPFENLWGDVAWSSYYLSAVYCIASNCYTKINQNRLLPAWRVFPEHDILQLDVSVYNVFTMQKADCLG